MDPVHVEGRQLIDIGMTRQVDHQHTGICRGRGVNGRVELPDPGCEQTPGRAG